MAIKRDVKVVIVNEESKLQEHIYVYQNDRGIDLYFDIVENKFTFTGTQSENIISRNAEIMYAGLTVRKPDGTGFFRPILPIEENRVIFRIEHEHTNDFEEIGMYELQIHLYDKFDNRVSLPPFKLEVKPLVVDNVMELSKDATIDYAVIGKSVVAEDVLFVIEQRDTGAYIRTEWKAGDVITESKINNIERGIERVSTTLESLEIPSLDGLATEEFVRGQIADIQIPDLEGLATEDFVQQAISNIDLSEFAKAEEVNAKIEEARTNLQSQIDTTNTELEAIKENVGNIEIPSIEGLATEQYVQDEIAKIDVPVVTHLATKEEVQEEINKVNTSIENTNTSLSATNQEIQQTNNKIQQTNEKLQQLEQNLGDIEIPSIEGLASEQYVQEQISNIEIPETSHLATKEEVESKITQTNSTIEEVRDMVENLEIPSIEGLATEQYVQDEINKIDVPVVTHLATKEEVNTKIAETNSNIEEVRDMVENLEIPSTDGLASEDFVREQISNIDMPETSHLATKEEVEAKVEQINASIEDITDNLLETDEKVARIEETVENLEIPSIDGLASEDYVNQKISEIDIPSVDGLASEQFVEAKIAEAEAKIDNVDNKVNELTQAVENIEIPSIEGLASESFVQEEIAKIEIPSTDKFASKEELQEGLKLYINDIGEDPHPECYKSEPQMLESETHYIRYKSYEGKYRVTYMDKYVELNNYSYISNNKVHLWALTNKCTFRTFEYNNGWSLLGQGATGENYIRIESTSDINSCNQNVYSSNIKLKNKAGTAVVVDIKEGDPKKAPLNNYNDATTSGNYYVYHKNAISSGYIDDIEGVLTVANAKGFVKQILTSFDGSINVFRVKGTNGWTVWKAATPSSSQTPEIDTNNYYTKGEVDNLISNIEIPEIPEMPDMDNYYNKGEVNDLISNIDIPQMPNMENFYNKDEVDNLISSIEIPEIPQMPDMDNYYNKGEVDNLLEENKPNLDGYYTKEETDAKLDNVSVDMSGYYTREETDELLDNVSVDLSSYATKEFVENAINNSDANVDLSNYHTKNEINELIGVPKGRIIEILNNMIGGI